MNVIHIHNICIDKVCSCYCDFSLRSDVCTHLDEKKKPFGNILTIVEVFPQHFEIMKRAKL